MVTMNITTLLDYILSSWLYFFEVQSHAHWLCSKRNLESTPAMLEWLQRVLSTNKERNTEKLMRQYNKYFSILTVGPQYTGILDIYKRKKI